MPKDHDSGRARTPTFTNTIMDSEMVIKRIAIVGGGTAGWLAANHIGFESMLGSKIEITLIESPDVPIIGVGEGTIPLIGNSLEKFGISELDLITQCETTFKHGIKFVGWLDPRTHGVDNYYYHPFAPAFPNGYNISPYMLTHRDKIPFFNIAEGVAACEAMLCPKKISSPQYQGELRYAYHFNAHKFANLLAKNAKAKYGVKQLFAKITSATRRTDGSIEALISEAGELLEFDFYVDCSGFSSILMERILNIPFIDKSHQILTDMALVQQVPTGENIDIPPYTKATAHSAGWIWDIPVSQRRGTGFVYSSAHMSEDVAHCTFAKYLGVTEDSISPRKIPMKIGYRRDFWVGNCIALGLSQGFVEPLEATSIFLTDMSAELFAQNLPRLYSDIEVLKKQCNSTVEYWWERTIDFVQLHYYISDRSDTKFWLDNTRNTHISETLRERLEIWRLLPPKKSDFFSHFDLFDASSYSYILYGMKFNTRQPTLSDAQKHESYMELDAIQQRSAKLRMQLPGHREWLTKLNEAIHQSKLSSQVQGD